MAKPSFENGRISFDLHELLSRFSGEDRIQLIETLSCDDEIFKHVSDQIIHRWTENSCQARSDYPIPAGEQYSSPLDTAWRAVAKASSDVARKEIEDLERSLVKARGEAREVHELRYKVGEYRDALKRIQSVDYNLPDCRQIAFRALNPHV